MRWAGRAILATALLVSVVACDERRLNLEDVATNTPEAGEVIEADTWVITADGGTTCVPFGRQRLQSHDSVKWSADGKKILFNVGPELYAVGSEGVGLRSVADASAAEVSNPGILVGQMTSFDVSPDSATVVYSTCEHTKVGAGGESAGLGHEDYEYELAAANLEDLQDWRLTRNDRFDNYPVWSPDGERIAFVSGGGPGDVEATTVAIYTMAADGTDRRVEAGIAAQHPPQWSPDGKRIVYVGRVGDGGRSIYVVVAGGSLNKQRLSEAVSGPTWSPGGESIAFAKADGDEVALYTIAVDGTDERRLATIEGWQSQFRYEEPDAAEAWIRKVAWSPDGTKILVLVNDDRYPGVEVIGADGSRLGWVTVEHPYPDSIKDATWSPDGTRMAMVGTFGSRPSIDPARSIAVLTMAADGTDVRVLVGRQVAGSVGSKRPFDGDLVGLAAVRGDISAHVAACGDGVAVEDPEANPGLVEDCKVLLEVQNALAGPWGFVWITSSSMSEWEGVVVEGTPPRVRQVVLNSRALGGEIPPELSRLTELRVLAMPGNALVGEIPTELGELKNLEQLNLRQNYLSGEIPPELGGLTRLMGLSLEGNNLRGKIPRELGELRRLTGLSLGHNDLEGEIPAALGQLTRLAWLNLRTNRLTGEIPAELGQLTEVRQLKLAYNELTGSIPEELGKLAGLKVLYVSGNQFRGCIPGGLREIESNDLADLELPVCE